MTIFLSTTFCRRSLPQRVLVCHFRRRRMCCLGYYLALLPNGKFICDNNLHYHLYLGVTFVFEIIILAIVVVLKKNISFGYYSIALHDMLGVGSRYNASRVK